MQRFCTLRAAKVVYCHRKQKPPQDYYLIFTNIVTKFCNSKFASPVCTSNF